MSTGKPIVGKPQTRMNAYGAKVVHQSAVANDSAGWTNQGLFAGLGDPQNEQGSREQEIEQVYLLENMVKGAMEDAVKIARNYKIGIAVRGTNVRSHMGIESGDPTKAQEFKNKTANEKDLLLCDEMTLRDLGTVVHFDPRMGWRAPKIQLKAIQPIMETSSRHWGAKLADLKHRLGAIQKDPRKKGVFIPKNDGDWMKVKSRFLQRGKEYFDEHGSYVDGGKYANHAKIEGIHVRLQVKGGAARVMVGDHDLFGFTNPDTHRFLPEMRHNAAIKRVQDSLQASNNFQAQHGGIWYWAPEHQKDKTIRERIMRAHGPQDDEPLIYFCGNEARPVRAAFYVKNPDRVESVWSFNDTNTKWYPSFYRNQA